MSSPAPSPRATTPSRSASAAALAVAAAVLAAAAAPALADEDPPATTPAETTPAQTTPVETTPTTTPEDAPSTPVEAPTAERTPAQAAPSQTPLAGWSDALPPTIGLAAVRTDLEDARRKGLRVTYRVTEPVTLRADVLIYGEVVDRELRMCALPAAGPGESLAKLTVFRTPTGTNVVRVPFNVPSRRTLRKFLKITVRVRLIATDASGNATTVIKTAALKRR